MVHRLMFLVIPLVLACGGPVGLLPGGRLSGELEPAPGNWVFAGDYGYMELETRPADPYSVNLAYTVLDGVLYANAGDSETRWVKNIAADPQVRIRMGETLYSLRAERVTNAAELARFGRAWTGHGSFYRDPSELDVAYVFRLVAP